MYQKENITKYCISFHMFCSPVHLQPDPCDRAANVPGQGEGVHLPNHKKSGKQN